MPRSLSLPVPPQRADRLSRLGVVRPPADPMARPVTNASDAGGPPRNRLLAALPAGELGRLRPYLERVELTQRESLYEPEEPIRYVFFPDTAVVSIVSTLGDGATVEVGTAGREGMVGLPVFLADESTTLRAFTQISGEAERIRATDFAQLANASVPFRRILLRYTQAFLTQVAQTAACNAAHLVEQRCARWLLMTHDRVEGEEFLLTHEFLAFMLGVRRAGVTVAMRSLQDAGVVAYTRGRVRILDREKLEAASCECYRVVRMHFDRLLSSEHATGPAAGEPAAPTASGGACSPTA